MRPTQTCHISRRMHKALSSAARIDHIGRPSGDVPFPDVHCANSINFRNAYMGYNLNRKIEAIGTDEEQAEMIARTIEAFFDTEAACSHINSNGVSYGPDTLDPWIILRARQLIADVIGVAPPVDWFQEASFSGGASTSRKRSDAHPALKWWASPSLHVTPLCLKHLLKLFDSMGDLGCIWENPGALSTMEPDFARSFIKIVPGSRLDTVEKNYKVRRVILIEPDGNMLLQKAVGSIIRKCLKKVGIDLNDQTRNQRLAFAGSITGLLATLDLKSASDSIALFIARLLLPTAWYELLYDLRSHLVMKPDGSWHKLEKLSSMGNGFTFEVESLIFWALTQATVDRLKPEDRRVGIYGDDIVVATAVATQLTSVLNQCGFQLNAEKSFWTGYFRESCGKHYHNGLDVTPVYIKGDLSSLEERFRLYNQLHNWEQGPGAPALSEIVLSDIAQDDRRQVPPEYDETSGIYNPDVCSSKVQVKRHRKWGTCIIFQSYSPSRKSLANRFESECAWLYRICERWNPTSIGFQNGILLDDEYTSVDLVREGERAWKTRRLPWVTAVMP